jgi:hypothetical protein
MWPTSGGQVSISSYPRWNWEVLGADMMFLEVPLDLCPGAREMGALPQLRGGLAERHGVAGVACLRRISDRLAHARPHHSQPP